MNLRSGHGLRGAAVAVLWFIGVASIVASGGGGGGGGSTEDTTPNTFTFTDVTGAVTNSTQTSNTITVSGINSPAAISVGGNASSQYSVNGGAFTSAAGTVNNGNTVAVHHTSSASPSTAVATTLTIGGVADTFTSTTLAQDTTPNAFTFTDVTGAVTNSTQTSNTITVSGINSPAAISVGGNASSQYSVNGGAFTSAAGTVNNGNTVAVHHTSSASPSTAVATTLTIGGVADTFTSTTAAAASSVVDGSVLYERILHSSVLGAGLDFSAIVEPPVADTSVEIVNATTLQVLASGTTTSLGRFSLNVPANTNVFVRVKAESVRQAPQALPHYDFRVRNATAGNSIYVFETVPFNSGAGVFQPFTIPAGWDLGTRYPNGTRHAAPFAILDDIKRARELVVTADPLADFGQLDVFWSGVEGSTYFIGSGPIPALHISGQADTDIDEYDSHVIVHEFGHFLQYRFSRDDTVFGTHDGVTPADLRLALSEGFGNGFAAIVLNDPVYRDTLGFGQANDANHNEEISLSPRPDGIRKDPLLRSFTTWSMVPTSQQTQSLLGLRQSGRQ